MPTSDLCGDERLFVENKHFANAAIERFRYKTRPQFNCAKHALREDGKHQSEGRVVENNLTTCDYLTSGIG